MLRGSIRSLTSHAAEHAAIGVGVLPPNITGAVKWFGSAQNGVTYNQTSSLGSSKACFGYKMEAEAPFDAVKFVWVNRAGNSITGCTLIAAVTETAEYSTAAKLSTPIIGGVSYPALAGGTDINGYYTATWNGAASGDIGSGASASTYGLTDWIPVSSVLRTDGGSRPLIMWAAQHDGSTGGNHAFMGTVPSGYLMRVPTAENRGRFVQTHTKTAGASAPDPAQTALIFNFNAYEVFPIFRYRVPSITVMVAGDSTEQNDAILLDGMSSWGWRACMDVSTPAKPINYINAGCSSKDAAEYWARAQELINAGVVPDVLVISPLSVNGTDWAALDRRFQTGRARALEIIDYAKSKGIARVVFIPLLPYNTLNSAQDTYRKAFNTWLQTISTGTVSTLTFPGLGDGKDPEKWVPAMNAKSGWQFAGCRLPHLSTTATGYVAGTTYTATITVDSTACAISFLGSSAATFGDLISVLNTQINTGMSTTGVTYASLFAGQILIKSATTGAASTVAITTGTAFASPLANWDGTITASAGAADGYHPNEHAIETVMAPALAAYLRAIA